MAGNLQNVSALSKKRELILRPPHLRLCAGLILELSSVPYSQSRIGLGWFALKDVPVTPSLHRPLSLQPRCLLLQTAPLPQKTWSR